MTLVTLDELTSILLDCWSKDTCFPSIREQWDVSCPSLGQCAVTSLIVQKYFGGKIKKCMVQNISHYYNELDGNVIDLTSEQFGNIDIDYNDSKEKLVDVILSNEDTKKRYELLLERVKQHL